jgi:DNA-directed RNA polymerase subunit F
MEWISNGAGRVPEELLSLRQRQERLLTVIADLLRTNEELRLKLAQTESRGDAAQADAAGGC